VVGGVYTVVVGAPVDEGVVVVGCGVVELGVVVEGVTTLVLAGLATLASTPTKRADRAPAATKRAWVKRRTRAKRRSRSWGVRGAGVISLF
jgi:hypothetical protein